MPAYEEDFSEFGRYDAQVLGLSIDTIPTIKAWAKSLGKISYPLLSDFWPHGQTALKYGVLRAEGFTERALFIVDKQGDRKSTRLNSSHGYISYAVFCLKKKKKKSK